MGTHNNRSRLLLLGTEVNGARMKKEMDVLPEQPVNLLAPAWVEKQMPSGTAQDPQPGPIPQPLPEKLNKPQKNNVGIDNPTRS